MPRIADPLAGAILALGRRISAPAARRLFARFCREIFMLSETMQAEASAYEITFRDVSGFCLVVTPFRELFIVSIGEERSSDVRVSSAGSFCHALDGALHCHLAAAAPSAAPGP